MFTTERLLFACTFSFPVIQTFLSHIHNLLIKYGNVLTTTLFFLSTTLNSLLLKKQFSLFHVKDTHRRVKLNFFLD